MRDLLERYLRAAVGQPLSQAPEDVKARDIAFNDFIQNLINATTSGLGAQVNQLWAALSAKQDKLTDKDIYDAVRRYERKANSV